MPDICAVPSAPVCPAVCRNTWRTPLLLGGDAELYPWSNYDAGVPSASFCVVGSQGPPCDPTLPPVGAESPPLTPRVASAAPAAWFWLATLPLLKADGRITIC